MKQPQTRGGDVIAGPPVNLPPPATWPESDVPPPSDPPTPSSCPHGHPWTAETLRYNKAGHRFCRTCKNISTQKAYQNRVARGGSLNAGRPRYVMGGTCLKGHLLDEQNAYIHKGVTRCKTCRAIWGKTYQLHQWQETEALRKQAGQAGHTDHYSLLPKIELFYSEQDTVWIARFRNTATLDGLSGLAQSTSGALIELLSAYEEAHGKGGMGWDLMANPVQIQEVPDAHTT